MLLLLLHAMRVSFPLIRDQDTIRSVVVRKIVRAGAISGCVKVANQSGGAARRRGAGGADNSRTIAATMSRSRFRAAARTILRVLRDVPRFLHGRHYGRMEYDCDGSVLRRWIYCWIQDDFRVVKEGLRNADAAF